MNQVNLIGRLTKDPELTYAAGNGTAICRFTLAVNRPRFDKNKPQEADFINCVCFGKRAEAIQKYVFKGNLFRVTGRIQINKYVDQKTQENRWSTDILVEDFEFLPNGNSSNSDSNNNSNNNTWGSNFEEDMTPVDDGDMPF